MHDGEKPQNDRKLIVLYSVLPFGGKRYRLDAAQRAGSRNYGAQYCGRDLQLNRSEYGAVFLYKKHSDKGGFPSRSAIRVKRRWTLLELTSGVEPPTSSLPSM